MTIGEKIKELRLGQGMTQEKLAAYLKISSQSVSKWENNNAMPDVSLLVPLANFLASRWTSSSTGTPQAKRRRSRAISE